MSIIPTWSFAAGALVVGLAGGAWGMHGYMQGRIDKIELAAAKAEATTAKDDLDNFKAAAEVITESALSGRNENAAILAQLAAIRKGQKYAPPPQLPADCKPGPVRLRNLAETATAADAAIARPVPGR